MLGADVLRDKSGKTNSSRTFFCSFAPWESKKPFFSGIIKDGLGQKVGDGGRGGKEGGTTSCKINVPLLQR